MNESPSCPPVLPLESATNESPLLVWARRLLACNPFYLISATCLLYGLYRLTLEPSFQRGALSQLAAIFGSLQLYEVLLVVTAIFLVSRRIWYDATLLVSLENMLVLVSFILITLATFQGPTVAWVVCGMTIAFAATKYWSIKRFFRELNLPLPLLGIGGSILAINVFVSFYCKEVLKVDVAPLEGCSYYAWLFGLPLLLGLVNLLKLPTHWPNGAAERSWLPLLTMAIWIVVSAIHLWCIDYIYDLPWQIASLAPLAWVGTWTAFYRIRDFTATPSAGLKTFLLGLPMVAVFLGIGNATASVVLGLAVLNVAIYGFISLRQPERQDVRHFLLVSLACLVGALPDSLGRILFVGYERSHWVVAALVSYTIGHALWSARPYMGAIGAITAALSARELLDRFPDSGHFTIATGLVFLLIHSLRWHDEDYAYAARLRMATAAAWVLQTLIWVPRDGAAAGWTAVGLAALVLFAYLLVYVVSRRWAARVIPIAAMLVLLLPPVKTVTVVTSTGFLAIGMAFVLCGIGTLFALYQDRWICRPRPCPRSIATSSDAC
jgi:hypothetical protein